MDIASLGIKIQTQGAKEAAADLDKLQTSATRAESSVKKIAPSARTSSEALALFSKIDPASNKLAALDNLEASLTRLSKAGKVSASDFAAMSAKLAESRAKIVGEGVAVKEAASLVERFTSNTRLMSEASTIASDVVSGQFGRIRRSAAAMANASGVFRLAFTGTGAAVLGVAAAVAALGVAADKASEETENFNKAIILTGNYADLSTAKLRAMAQQIAQSSGATTGKASEVLAQVAASGKFTAEQMQLVSKAAVEMEQATGRSIGETVKEFASLKGDPVQALLKLNEATDDGKGVTHFLTQEVLNNVKALKEQGRESEAVTVAIKALFDAMDQRAPAAAKSMSLVGGVLHTIAEEAKHDLDTVVGFFRGADEAIKSFLVSHEKSMRALAVVMQNMPGNIFGQAQSEALNSMIDAAKNAGRPDFSNVTSSPLVNSDQEAARERFDKDGLRYATERQRMEREIADARRDGVAAGKSDLEIQQRINAIRASFASKAPKAGGGIALEGAQSRAALQAYEDEIKREQGAIANQTQLLEANYAARNISAEKYYDEQKRLSKAANDAQIHALEGEIAVLQARNVKGKQSVDNARELAEKEAELAKVRADGATKAQVLDIQEAALLKQRQQANQAYKDALDQNTNALKADFDSQVLRIGTGEREFAIQSQINQLYRDGAKELLALARARDAGEIDQNTYIERANQLRAAVEDEVQITRDGYARMAEAQANWKNGALKAFADYRDAANDVAGQVNGIFNDAFRGLEDVLVSFFTKGKADWKGFLDSIAADITRFVVRQQLSKLFAKFMPGSQNGDQASALSGAAGKLAASAAPLYGAAAALSASAAALAAAGTGGGSGGGSGGYAGIISSIAGMWGGGRASGGPVSAGMVYEVGEGNQPEILQMHGRSYLMPGNQGNVIPLSAGRSGPTVVNQTVVVQGRIDSRTPTQFAQATAREQNRASVRNR